MRVFQCVKCQNRAIGIGFPTSNSGDRVFQPFTPLNVIIKLDCLPALAHGWSLIHVQCDGVFVWPAEDGLQDRCEVCGQSFTASKTASGNVRPTRCHDCVVAMTTVQPARRGASAGESGFSIHSLVGDTAPPPSGHQPNHQNTTSASSSPFLVHAHAQYYALATSGLLPAMNFGSRSTRVPIDWASATGKHRYGV